MHGLRRAARRRRARPRRRRRSPTPGRSRCSRSARRRGATRSARRSSTGSAPASSRSLAIHSATDSCYGWQEYGAARRRPLRRPPVDADDRPRRRRRRPSRRRAHLGADVALARRGVPVPRPAARRRGAAAGAATAQLDLDAPGATRPDVRLPARVVLRRGRGPRVLDQPRPLPRRVGEPGVPASPAGGLTWALARPEDAE